MFEVKPKSVEKKEAAVGTADDGVCAGGDGMEDSVYLYEGRGWLLSPEQPSAISPLLAQETLSYMILSAERVEQMARTYNDIEVVTHLLAKRDRDLQQAARIGQSLLQTNHVLQERNDSLEEQLAQVLDQVHQLQHELTKKEELLRMVASASEESETDSSCSTPLCQPSPAGVSHALSQLEALQSKLHELEEENQTLRSEARHLKKETITYEEKEQRLVSDCVKELRESNSQMVTLTEELAQKGETVQRQQEDIAQLLAQIVELQHRVKELALEKEELRFHLQASKDAQRQLTAELKEMADRNVECVGMLQESQEELKELRSKNSCAEVRRPPYGLYPMDSLAAEIEGTMRRELSIEEEIALQDQRSTYERVFQTVRSVRAAVGRASAPPIPGSGHCGTVMTAQPFSSQANRTQEQNTHEDILDEAPVGQPSSPGGNDLISALHRLSLRRQNFLCERQYFQAERDRKLHEISRAGSEGVGSGYSSPMGSALSSFTNLSDFSVTSSCFKTFLPEKLQIVKPMEGSLTLHHWQQLAQPHLASVLHPHPGVVTKGFRPLPQDTIYHLSDLEEDEEHEKPPWEERRDGGKTLDERIAEEEEEEGEEGGIIFHVQSSSTPEERRERGFLTPVKGPPLPPSLRASPVATTTAVSLTAAANLAVTSAPSLTSVPTTSASVPASQPSLTVSTMAPSAVNPGKGQGSTFSTYTFTTCRILHPSDVTQVTPSSACRTSICEYTPSSLRSGPSTPVTPCRLGLEDTIAPHRTAAAPGGLAKLLREKGISAQGAPAPSQLPRRGPLKLFPTTPPNSPSQSPCPSPLPFEYHSVSSDNFLASRPAELFLQDVYGVKLGRAPRPDLPSPEPVPVEPLSSQDQTSNLVQRLRKLGLDRTVLRGAEGSQESANLLVTGGSLLDGLRRNQSLPAMIGRRHTSVSSPSHPAPPTQPTSLGLAGQSRASLKPNSTRRHSSLSYAPPLPYQH